MYHFYYKNFLCIKCIIQTIYSKLWKNILSVGGKKCIVPQSFTILSLPNIKHQFTVCLTYLPALCNLSKYYHTFYFFLLDSLIRTMFLRLFNDVFFFLCFFHSQKKKYEFLQPVINWQKFGVITLSECYNDICTNMLVQCLNDSLFSWVYI